MRTKDVQFVNQTAMTCDPKKLKKGSIVSSCLYYTVTKDVEDHDTHVQVRDEDGNFISISTEVISDGNYHSADQFTSTEEVTRTDLVNHLANARDSVFSVAFNKQPAVKDVVDAASEKDEKKRAKLVREAMRGESRVLRGYLAQIDTHTGRTTVIDMDAKGGVTKQSKLRQVDHRSIEYLIMHGKKYVAK